MSQLSALPLPKKIAFGFLILFIFTGLLIYQPISEVFRGEYILNQNLISWDIGSVEIFDTTIQIGSVLIRFYAVCILLGVLFGYTLTLVLAKYKAIPGIVIDRLLIGSVFFGLIGSRLFYVLFNWDFFIADPLLIINLSRGGLSFFGMLIGAGTYIGLYCWHFKYSIYELLDVLAPGVLLGQIIGRWGNFFNYESYGGPTSVYWKMFVPTNVNLYDPNEQYFHPTFLYEIIANSILLCILLYTFHFLTFKKSGLIFALYGIGYGIIRIITEFFRIDALKYSLPFRINVPYTSIILQEIYVSQVAACMLLIGCLFLLMYRKNKLHHA